MTRRNSDAPRPRQPRVSPPAKACRLLPFEVQNLQPRPYGEVLATFDLVLGTRDDQGQFTGSGVVKGMRLRAKTGGYWLQFPGTLRRDRFGAPVLDAAGRRQYVTHISLAKGPDGKTSEAGRRFGEAVTAAAAALFKATEQVPRTGIPEPRPLWPSESTNPVFTHQTEQLVSAASDWLFRCPREDNGSVIGVPGDGGGPDGRPTQAEVVGHPHPGPGVA